ncbi:flagellar hook assembly protein FlgD [Paraferrimonas sp. SM1919]|uniref:flagellar hook assembly protein FlgD n=1 Tax=Paraferrimonas sp. SM1919 TaxID=2662263 RepID=UPI0013D58FA9|nr:flagellar hook capping FlgD N-terminal domain-containing protein [Paraferrimonas sp. SM1919]
MEINNINQYNSQLGTSGQSSASLKNEFLQMMVAQINNQDPLNPMDGTEYVSQLAQFSQVESLEFLRMEQSSQNVLLNNLQVLQTTNLVGKEVVLESNTIALTSEPQQAAINLASSADQVTVTLKDEYGAEVAQINLGQQHAGENQYHINPEELGLEPGTYSLEINATAGDEMVPVASLVNATVDSVKISGLDGSLMLNLAGIGQVPLFQVREIGA